MLIIYITALVALLTLLAIVDGQQAASGPQDNIAQVLEDCKKPQDDFFCLGILTKSDADPIAGFPEGEGCLAEGADPCNTLVVGRRTAPDASSFKHVYEWHFYNRARETSADGSGFSHFIVSSSSIPIPDASKKFLFPKNTIGIDGSYVKEDNVLSVTRWAPGNTAGGSRISDSAPELAQLFGYKDTKKITTADQQKWFRHSYSSGDTLIYKFLSTNVTYSVNFKKELYALIAVGQRNQPKQFSFYHTAQPLYFFDHGPDSAAKVFGELYGKCSTTSKDSFCVGAKLGRGSALIEVEDGCVKEQDCDALVYAKLNSDGKVLYTLVKTKDVRELVFYLTKETGSTTLDDQGLPPKTVGVRMVGSPKQIASDADSGDKPAIYDVTAEKPRMITFTSKEELSFTNGYAVNLATDELFTVLSMTSIATEDPFVEHRPAKARKLFPKEPTTIAPSTPVNATTPKPKEKSGLGMTIAIVIGVLLVVALLVGVAWYLMTKQKGKTTKSKDVAKVESSEDQEIPEDDNDSPPKDSEVRAEKKTSKEDIDD